MRVEDPYDVSYFMYSITYIIHIYTYCIICHIIAGAHRGQVPGALPPGVREAPPGLEEARGPGLGAGEVRVNGGNMVYRRFQKVGTWIEDDLCWLSFFRCFGVGGRACSNFLASTV